MTNGYYLAAGGILLVLLLFWLLGLVGSTHRANAASRLASHRTAASGGALLRDHSQIADAGVVWGKPLAPRVTGLITNVRWGLHD